MDIDSDSAVCEAGLIQSVAVKNFMCHENLKFDFHPNVNFIVGLNGSGKSAILTAVILALGGKSNFTGRFSNLRGFIKTGKTTATVTVTLKNTGSNAYKPDVYGDCIIVERVIHSTQERISSTYKLKSQRGQIISSTREELNMILNAMSIEVDNPVSVLTQEASRTFLDNNNPRSKYKFFYKGTRLEKVKQNYEDGKEAKVEIELQLATKKEVIPDIEKDIKMLERLRNNSEKIKDYEHELIWAEIIEREKLRDQKKLKYDECAKEKEKLEKIEQDYENGRQQLDSLKITLECVEKEKVTAKTDMGNIRTTRDATKGEKRQLVGMLNRYEREYESASRELQNLKHDIETTEAKNEEEIAAEKEKREQFLSQCRQQLNKLETQRVEYHKQKESLLSTSLETQPKIDEVNSEVKGMEMKRDKIKQEILNMESAVKNRINSFGPCIQEILNDIKVAARNGKFKQIPRGPLGRYVTVKDNKYCFAVELCLNAKFLRSFSCDNFKDQQVLRNIFQKYVGTHQFVPPSIIVSEFQTEVYDVSSGKVNCQFPTVLDMINISDVAVTNCLIDQRQIERVIVSDDFDALNQKMMYNPPPKCTMAYLVSGDQIYPSPNHRYYSCRTRNCHILGTITPGVISERKQELQKLENQLADKQKIRDRALLDFNALNHKIKDMNTVFQQISQKKQGLLQKISTTNLEPIQERFHSMNDELKELNNRFLECSEKKKRVSSELASLDSRLEEEDRIYQEKTQIYNDCNQKCINLKSEMMEFYNKTTVYDNVCSEWPEKKERIREQLEESEKEYRNLETSLQEQVKNAEKECARVKTSRKPESLKKMIEDMRTEIERLGNCSERELEKNRAEKIKMLQSIKKEIKDLSHRIKSLDVMIVKREENFITTRRTTEASFKSAFALNMRSIDFCSELIFDHEEKTLQIKAAPMKGSSREYKSTKELSGGERSLVTICFIISLWHCLKMPFRILDEYDIFLDSANRVFSLNLLLSRASEERDVQFIFLTPQNLPQLDDYSEITKVHNLKAPERRE